MKRALMKRTGLILLALMIAVPLAALAAAHWYLNGDMMRARVVEAVRQATGRELTIAGPIRLAWSLAPTVEAKDVSLSNPPGFSRPDMAHIDRVQAQVALLPLLSRRVEIRHVQLAGPDVLLERDAQGHPNWVFNPPAPTPGPAPEQASPSGGQRFDFVLGDVQVRDAKFGWRGPEHFELAAPRLAYAPGDGTVGGELLYNGVKLALTGTAGPIEGAAWPLKLQLAGGGLTASLSGTSAEAGLAVQAADLSSAAALAGRSLPALHDVLVAATLSSAGLTGLQVQAGPSSLGSALGAVQLQRAALTAPSLTGPAELHATLAAGKLPIAVAAQVGFLAGLTGAGPVPVSLHVSTDDAVLDAKGTLTGGRSGALLLTARAGDVARAGVLAGVALPPLREMQAQTQVTLAADAVTLHRLRVTSAQGDVSGDLVLALGGKPSLRGALSSQRLDLDALSPQPLPAAANAAPPAPAPAAPTPAPAPSDRVIPDTKLPFAALRGQDADLQLNLAEAIWRGRTYHAVQAHAVLQDGRLRLDPASMAVGTGTLKAQLDADGAAQPPTVSMSVDAPGLPAGPALALVGGPDSTTGSLDLRAQLRGQGDTLRAVAATLDGHVGLALVGGEIENRWLEGALADALRAASLPVDTGGVSKVRCAAIRADASAGRLQFRALTLDTTRLKLDGSGEINLGDETLDLHLQPQLRLGTALSVPVRVRGTLRAPKVALDPGAISPGRVGIILGGAAPADTCGPALALARDGQAGVAPSALEPQANRATKPADLLRSLLR